MQGSGKSSAAIWTAFDNAVTSAFRILRFSLKVAWTRVRDETSGYAIVGTSLVSGTDLVKGQSGSVAEPDLYSYFDETDRAVRIEYDRRLIEPLGGIAMALMDITLDNHDLRFTPDQNATIGTALLPNRPINAHIGLYVQGRNVTVPVFKGLTRTPRELKSNRTAQVTCIDFVKYLDEYPLESAIYTDQRSDQIIEDILNDVGFGSTQYELDEGLNTIGFAWFTKGDTAGERIKKICEAEEAIFYQDEEGMLRFENRRAFSRSPYSSKVWDIDPSDIIMWENDESTPVINKCLVKAKPREVQSVTEIWRDGVEEVIPGNGELIVWAEFDNPASTVTNPAQDTDFKAFTVTGGGGSDITSDVSISISSFTTTVKLTITNANANDAYMNILRLRGTPATITGVITQTAEDSVSISKYDESQLTIENDFIDDGTYAKWLAKAIVTKYAKPIKRLRLTVQGLPQIQLRDKVQVTDQDLDTSTNYRVMRIQGSLTVGQFTQTLYLREVTSSEADSWALIGVATIGNVNSFIGKD